MLAAVMLAALSAFMLLPAAAFADVQETDWFHTAVTYAQETELFHGVSATRFAPQETMTRGMFVTVLFNRSGEDPSRYNQQHFVDTPREKWYTSPVEWAAAYRIVNGVRAFRFAPEQPVTREQMVTMLYRYAQATGNDTTVKPSSRKFADAGMVSAYAKTAISWAVGHGILQGDTRNRLNPQGLATRAEAAQMFYNARKLLKGTAVQIEAVSLPLPSAIEWTIQDMTMEERIGQLFLPRLPDGDVNALTRRYHPAGYTLYGKDFTGKTRQQVQQTLQSYQSASQIPLLLAVDEEGGSVVRVSSNKNLRPAPFPSMQALYQAGGVDAIVADTREKARFLLDLGINLNLAPVCDVSVSAGDYIYDRTLGLPAADTADVIAALVTAMEEENLSGALKHFPGYGNNRNTHTGISIDRRPYEQFQQQDFLPFAAGIRAGAPSVLVSHNIVTAMDPDRPASLSKPVHEILRNELQFDGVIMTDDLSMDAIKLYTDGQSPAVAAFLAGNDLLLTSDWKQDYRALLTAARAGAIPAGRIEESLRRILTWKKCLLP